jgi:O-antigen ligase
MLFATHTRTALLGLGVGLAVAVASLFLGFARVRRVSLIAIAVGLVSAVALAPLLATWLLRGQTTSELGQLTGRTAVWEQVFATPRGFMTTVAGSGMSNASFNGLPIDSNWVATFVDLGLLGITLQVLAILVLLITAVVRPRGQARAAALFLVVYFIAASFTEVGLNAPTTYLLDLTVAASLLARPVEARDTEAAS